MHFSQTIEHLAGTKARARTLTTLAWRPGRVWSGRALALESGISQPQAQQALNQLAQEGIVLRLGGEKTALWQFNERHLLSSHVEALARAKFLLYDTLANELDKRVGFKVIRKAVVFGSVPKGKESAKSDIDLYLEIDDNADRGEVSKKVFKLAAELAPRLGMLVSPIIFTGKEAAAKKKRAVMLEIGKSGVNLEDFAKSSYVNDFHELSGEG